MTSSGWRVRSTSAARSSTRCSSRQFWSARQPEPRPEAGAPPLRLRWRRRPARRHRRRPDSLASPRRSPPTGGPLLAASGLPDRGRPGILHWAGGERAPPEGGRPVWRCGHRQVPARPRAGGEALKRSPHLRWIAVAHGALGGGVADRRSAVQLGRRAAGPSELHRAPRPSSATSSPSWASRRSSSSSSSPVSIHRRLGIGFATRVLPAMVIARLGPPADRRRHAAVAAHRRRPRRSRSARTAFATPSTSRRASCSSCRCRPGCASRRRPSSTSSCSAAPRESPRSSCCRSRFGWMGAGTDGLDDPGAREPLARSHLRRATASTSRRSARDSPTATSTRRYRSTSTDPVTLELLMQSFASGDRDQILHGMEVFSDHGRPEMIPSLLLYHEDRARAPQGTV